MKMKKSLAILFPLILIAIIVAWGSGKAAPTTTSPTTEVIIPAPTPTKTAAASSTSAQKYGGVVHYIHNGGVPSLGSLVDVRGVNLFNLYPMYETLLRTDENERIITTPPALAEACEVAADRTSITLRLRKGIKFHDGTDFNAEAVKYNLEQDYAAKIIGFAPLANVSSYDILDPYTIRINLKKYDATLLLRLSQSSIGMVVSPTAMKKTTTPENAALIHAVGTGPFILDSWQRDNFIKYKKNPNYWQTGKPYLDGFEIRTIADLSVALMSFKSKEAEFWCTIDPSDAVQLKKDGYNVYLTEFQLLHALYPDAANPDSPFANKKVREALEYAIDKESLAQGVGMGYFTAAYQFASPRDPWYVPGLTPRTYNPTKAKQLLAEAGYPNGVKTTLLTDIRVRRDTLVAVQTYLKEAGFDCVLDIADVTRITNATMQGWKGILMLGFPTPLNFVSVVGRFGDATSTVSMYRPANWQAKWDAIVSQPDYDKRMAQMKEMIKTIYDECIAIPYHFDGDRYALVGVNDLNHYAGRTVRWYDPANIWLSK